MTSKEVVVHTVGKVGEVARFYWYDFDDGTFSFHTAHLVDSDETVTFRSRMDTWASVSAARLGVIYRFLRNAKDEEIKTWLEKNPQFEVRKVHEV